MVGVVTQDVVSCLLSTGVFSQTGFVIKREQL
jgi:hypothetical protein